MEHPNEKTYAFSVDVFFISSKPNTYVLYVRSSVRAREILVGFLTTLFSLYAHFLSQNILYLLSRSMNETWTNQQNQLSLTTHFLLFYAFFLLTQTTCLCMYNITITLLLWIYYYSSIMTILVWIPLPLQHCQESHKWKERQFCF